MFGDIRNKCTVATDVNYVCLLLGKLLLFHVQHLPLWKAKFTYKPFKRENLVMTRALAYRLM